MTHIQHNFGVKRSNSYCVSHISGTIFAKIDSNHFQIRAILSIIFGIKRSNFHSCWHTSETVFANFSFFCMIVIDQEIFKLISSIFSFDPCCAWFWDQNVKLTLFWSYLGNSSNIRLPTLYPAANINISNTFVICQCPQNSSLWGTQGWKVNFFVVLLYLGNREF